MRQIFFSTGSGAVPQMQHTSIGIGATAVKSEEIYTN